MYSQWSTVFQWNDCWQLCMWSTVFQWNDCWQLCMTRVSSHGVAMRTIKVLYPNIIDIDCYSHTIDHVGEHFKAPTLEEFIRLWISLFAHSPRTRLAWKELTGRAMSTYSEIRWWSRWEVCNQVLWQFGDVLPFLQPHPEFFSNYNSKACTTFDWSSKGGISAVGVSCC